MPFEKIHLICPVENSAEEEYTKKCLRSMGCQVYQRAVNGYDARDWLKQLYPVNEYGGIDIVFNYYGEGRPFEAECERMGIRRIFFYFDMNRRLAGVTNDPVIWASKENLRQIAMENLVGLIWQNRPQEHNSVQSIIDLYQGITRVAGANGILVPQKMADDLFFLMQAKRSLRVMTMGEVINDPHATIDRIPLYAYVRKILDGLRRMYQGLIPQGQAVTCYELYARINAALNMWNIRDLIYENDLAGIENLFPTAADVYALMQQLLDWEPNSISARLLHARLCECRRESAAQIETAYQRVLQCLPANQRSYAYVWYRVGYYYDKKRNDKELALRHYTHAVKLDPEFYQAVFKLGQFAAREGRFAEADSCLNDVIRIMFHGRYSGPDPNDTYPNWAFLSLKDTQYAYKAYVLMASIAIKDNREFSAKGAIGRACLAATKFENSNQERALLLDAYNERDDFRNYHVYSMPVRCMWKALLPWCKNITQDQFVITIVENRLSRWR